MEPLTELKDVLTPLPRGGHIVDTPAGYVQFGSPPETIKDTMALPKSVPQIFVLPSSLFNWKKGINISDLEFPIYYNFFLKKRKTLVIGTKAQTARLLRALQEALFGPKQFDLKLDYHAVNEDVFIPDIRREMSFFRGSLQFSDVISLGFFKNNQYKRGDLAISIDASNAFEVYYSGKKLATVPGVVEYKSRFNIGERLPEPYQPPLFGVTCLGPSHGFDPKENTSGFIVWLNHNGIMVDPPVDSTEWLEDSNVNPKLIDSIILTHAHADHDAGTLQKILEEGKITIYTTPTVRESFLRKYSSMTGEPFEYLANLFHYRPVAIGQPVYIHGGEFNFFYSLHSIPVLGFALKFQNQSFVYSSDHQGDPAVQKKLFDEGVIHEKRYEQLKSFPWDSKVIYHESGIAPLHTPITHLNSLPEEVQRRIVVYHIATKDFPQDTHLTLARFGIEHTLYFDTTPPAYENTYQLLGVLKHLDFFDSLPVEKVQEFVSIIEEERFKKGDVIVKQGTPGDKFYIICSGNVAIVYEKVIAKKIFGTHEYFGEIALLTGATRAADVMAATDVLVYTIEKDKFLSFIYGTDFEKVLLRLIGNRNPETSNLLFESPFFQPLTSYQKTWLESMLIPVELDGSGTLIEEGQPLNEVCLISQGEVQVTRQGEARATLKRGDFIGAMHKIQRGEVAEYTFSHEQPISVFVIEREDVLEFSSRNPGLAMKLAYDF